MKAVGKGQDGVRWFNKRLFKCLEAGRLAYIRRRENRGKIVKGGIGEEKGSSPLQSTLVIP